MEPSPSIPKPAMATGGNADGLLAKAEAKVAGDPGLSGNMLELRGMEAGDLVPPQG